MARELYRIVITVSEGELQTDLQVRDIKDKPELPEILEAIEKAKTEFILNYANSN